MKNNEMVLVVDMQKGFINEHTKHLITKINLFIKASNSSYKVATKFINHKNSAFVKLLNWEGMMNKDEQEFAVELTPDVKILPKSTYNCLTDDLKKYIIQNKINKVHMVGVDTDACILTTALALFDFGVQPVIYRDLCASTGGAEMHSAAIDVLNRNIGESNVLQ